MTYESSFITQMFEEVYRGKRHAFPPHFFVGSEGKLFASMITRYALEKKGWNRDEICLNISRDFFQEYRLSGMLKTCFGSSVFAALDNTYPNEFKAWELVRARRNIFSGPNGCEMARQAVRWMILEKLRFSDKDLHKIGAKTFVKYHLDGVLHTMYQGSPWEAIRDAGLFNGKPWEIGLTPKGYWQGAAGRLHAIQAVKWLVEEKYKFLPNELPAKIRHAQFKNHGLAPMLEIVFKGSPYEAINAAYPGRFKKWQFCSVGNGYWTGSQGLKHAIEAMEWLINEKLKVTEEEIPFLLNKNIFKEFGLDGMFSELFRRSISKALDLLYPGKFNATILHRAKRSSF